MNIINQRFFRSNTPLLTWALVLAGSLIFGIYIMTVKPHNPAAVIWHQVTRLVRQYTASGSATVDDIQSYRNQKAVSALPRVPVTASTAGPLYADPTNPRYFTDGSGRVVYLTGSHTWLNLQDGMLTDPPPPFDYSQWLDFLATHHHNFFRLWTWETAKWVVEWPEPYYFTPLPYQRTGPGTALDGKPKFDLTKLNQAYFDRLRQRVQEADSRGFYVSIMLFNGWSVAHPKGSYGAANPWLGHPFHLQNNMNNINGDTNGDNSGTETHELGDSAITAIQEAYVAKVIDTVNEFNNILYEVSNESHADSQEWQYHIINFIKEYEAQKAKQHPVGMTVEWPEGSNDDLFASNADWVSLNGPLEYPPAASGAKVIIHDTDHLCGICGNRSWVWKSFTSGLNPIFMDQYDDGYQLDGGGYDVNNANDVSLRRNLGYTRLYANRLNLAAMQPRGDLASTGYCLANPSAENAEYLVYAPDGGPITVDLSTTTGQLTVEWFNPATGETINAEAVNAGAERSVEAPFAGDAVLYLYQRTLVPTTTPSVTATATVPVQMTPTVPQVLTAMPTPPYRLFVPAVGQ